MKNRETRIITDTQLRKIIRNVISKYVSAQEGTDNVRIDSEIPDITSNSPSFNNMEFIKHYLNEGLIMSYSADSVNNILCREFNLSPNQVQLEERSDNGNVVTLINVVLPINASNDVIGKIKHRMNSCGYFCPTPIQYNKQFKIAILLFEPKYSTDVSAEIKSKYKFLFHSTPKIYLQKILKVGIIPRSKNTLFMYPDRIYCMRGDNLTKEQLGILKNVQTVRNHSVQNNNKQNEYVLLTIDVRKLPETIKMYIDPMSPNAILTHDNIPPTSIIKYEDFTL